MATNDLERNDYNPLLESCLTGVKEAKTTLGGGNTPETTVDLAKIAAEFADTTIATFPMERPIACRKGCSWCCTVNVNAMVSEVLTIAEHIRTTFAPDEQARVDAAINEHIRVTNGMRHMERHDVRITCPFLKDNACSIYPVRPAAYRGWHSFSAEACQRDAERPKDRRTVPQNGIAVGVSAVAQTGVRVALQAARLRPP